MKLIRAIENLLQHFHAGKLNRFSMEEKRKNISQQIFSLVARNVSHVVHASSKYICCPKLFPPLKTISCSQGFKKFVIKKCFFVLTYLTFWDILQHVLRRQVPAFPTSNFTSPSVLINKLITDFLHFVFCFFIKVGAREKKISTLSWWQSFVPFVSYIWWKIHNTHDMRWMEESYLIKYVKEILTILFSSPSLSSLQMDDDSGIKFERTNEVPVRSKMHCKSSNLFVEKHAGKSVKQ